MKLDKIIHANDIVISLGRLPLDIGYKFFKLHKSFEPQVEFYHKELAEIAQKYPYTADDGILKFNSKEDRDAYLKDLEDLANMDIEFECDKPEIMVSDKLNLSVEDIDVLSEFVRFI